MNHWDAGADQERLSQTPNQHAPGPLLVRMLASALVGVVACLALGACSASSAAARKASSTTVPSTATTLPSDATLTSHYNQFCQAIHAWDQVVNTGLNDPSNPYAQGAFNQVHQVFGILGKDESYYIGDGTSPSQSIPAPLDRMYQAWEKVDSEYYLYQSHNSADPSALVVDIATNMVAVDSACSRYGTTSQSASTTSPTSMEPSSSVSTPEPGVPSTAFLNVVSQAQGDLRSGAVADAPPMADAILSCPITVPVEAGQIFACTVFSSAGTGWVVIVTINGSDGTFSVAGITPGSTPDGCGSRYLNSAQLAALAKLPGYSKC
ncbi:MAG: hypothetical protein KGQ66_04595 [Acidobacteriota bacterium]|nr:hypothetical protein [Acidobacteriota bacterium]